MHCVIQWVSQSHKGYRIFTKIVLNVVIGFGLPVFFLFFIFFAPIESLYIKMSFTNQQNCVDDQLDNGKIYASSRLPFDVRTPCSV